MEKYTFKKRNEAIDFLDKFGFKYYVPRLEEKMDVVPVENKFYSIEIVNNKVSFCCIDKTEYNAYASDISIFYNSKHAYNFYTKDAGEQNYKEWLEYKTLAFED